MVNDIGMRSYIAQNVAKTMVHTVLLCVCDKSVKPTKNTNYSTFLLKLRHYLIQRNKMSSTQIGLILSSDDAHLCLPSISSLQPSLKMVMIHSISWFSRSRDFPGKLGDFKSTDSSVCHRLLMLMSIYLIECISFKMTGQIFYFFVLNFFMPVARMATHIGLVYGLWKKSGAATSYCRWSQ